jgi:hypothetical protein
MQLIGSALVCVFFLQYYLTLALSIVLTLLRKAAAWAVGGKDLPNIHPYRNAHEEVFAWKGKWLTMQRSS